MEVSARTRNAFLTVFGVIAAIVLVAVASRGSTSLGDSTTRKPSDALTDILFALYLVALIGGADHVRLPPRAAEEGQGAVW